jgi:hypothetical protein
MLEDVIGKTELSWVPKAKQMSGSMLMCRRRLAP